MDDLVRPFVHKILVVIEPLLIDEDYYARVEVSRTILESSTRGDNTDTNTIQLGERNYLEFGESSRSRDNDFYNASGHR